MPAGRQGANNHGKTERGKIYNNVIRASLQVNPDAGEAQDKTGEREEDISPVIHVDMSPMQFVDPGLNRNPVTLQITALGCIVVGKITYWVLGR
jgi:hypothetical protein